MKFRKKLQLEFALRDIGSMPIKCLFVYEYTYIHRFSPTVHFTNIYSIYT